MITAIRKPLRLAFVAALITATVSFESIKAHPPQQDQQTSQATELEEAATLSASVIKLFNEGELGEALSSAKRALEIRRRLLPNNDPLIEISLTYVGDIYLAKGDFSGATLHYEELLKKKELRLGVEDISLASILDRLAAVYFQKK